MTKYKYPEVFELLWALYPKRNGNNPKRKAFNAYKARLNQGHTHEDMEAGLKRYSKYCGAANTKGTCYVMHGATFFGPDENFLEDWTPPEPERKTESIEDKGKRLNILPKVGESMEAYKQRIQQARG